MVVPVILRIRRCHHTSRGNLTPVFPNERASKHADSFRPRWHRGCARNAVAKRDANPYPTIGNPRSLRTVAEAAKDCRACDLWSRATQTVFGEGPRTAKVVFVGEQPGDKEDLAGHPFVGPAGRVLDEALAEVGIDRKRVFVTNAVKHFKWKARGKRRIHDKPNAAEIAACRPWLDGELRLVSPRILVPLGATA